MEDNRSIQGNLTYPLWYAFIMLLCVFPSYSTKHWIANSVLISFCESSRNTFFPPPLPQYFCMVLVFCLLQSVLPYIYSERSHRVMKRGSSFRIRMGGFEYWLSVPVFIPGFVSSSAKWIVWILLWEKKIKTASTKVWHTVWAQ